MSTVSKYVSRGGDKLSGALTNFGVDPKGKVAMDIGCSTGGFTDCLLKAGAKSVWAVDVAYGVIDWKLRNDPRVHVLERCNIRHLEKEAISDTPSLIVIDISFNTLDKILPNVGKWVTPSTDIVALVKPQFEGTPKEVPGGFVKDETTRQAIISRVRSHIQELGYRICAEADSAIKGRKGNQETFFHLKHHER